jgi:CheY-specific phosphatase CheX
MRCCATAQFDASPMPIMVGATLNTLNDALIAEVLARNDHSATQLRGAAVGLASHGSDARAEDLLPRQPFASCLDEAAQCVFSTMCGLPLERTDTLPASDVIDQPHISGIISLSGAFKSNVILNLHLDLVFAASQAMLGMTVERVDEDVLDLARELTNMVAGKSKERLSMCGVSLGLPTVVAGTYHQIALKSDASIETLGFRSPAGPLLIEYSVSNSPSSLEPAVH